MLGRCWIACAVTLCVSTWASAAPIQVAISGTITTLNDPGSLLPGGIGLGDPFSGTYTLDSVAPGLPSNPQAGVYLYPADPSASVSIDVDGNLFNQAPTSLGLLDDVFNSNLGVLQDQWFTQVSGLSGVRPAVFFGDTTLSNVSGPSYFVNTSLSGWTQAAVLLLDTNGGIGPFPILAVGTISTLQVIPEPSTAALLALGLVGLGVRRRAG